MSTPYSQINVQMNQNNFSSERHTKQRPKFCTSNEQAAVLQSKQCAKCGGAVENKIS
jgi:hypothetical protein